MKKIIINTSTYKSSKDETTPDFINSMIKSLNKKYDQIEIVVLRPMKDIYEEVYFENNYKVVPYRYLWSIKGQTLWKYGLKPAYDINKLNINEIHNPLSFENYNHETLNLFNIDHVSKKKLSNWKRCQ